MRSFLFVLFVLACSTVQLATASKNVYDETYLCTAENFTTIVIRNVMSSKEDSKKINYCASLIRPNVWTLKDTLMAMVANGDEAFDTNNILTWTSEHTLDFFCRQNINCDLRKKVELNRTKEIFRSLIQHCECQRDLQSSIRKRFDKQFEGLLGFVFSLQTRKCYNVDHPIIKCRKYQLFALPEQEFTELPNGFGTESIRCLEYELDTTKPKMYQTFDMPFYFKGLSSKYYERIKQGGINTIIRAAMLIY